METPQDIYGTAPREPDGRHGRLLVITDRPERFAHYDRTCVQTVKPFSGMFGTRVDRLFIDGAVEITPLFVDWLQTSVFTRCVMKWHENKSRTAE